MLPPTAASYNDHLDVLKRFAPTPYRALARIGPTGVAIETNDAAMLILLFDLMHGDSAPAVSTFLWKIVRDTDLPSEIAAPVILVQEGVAVANMGAALLAGVDAERKELLAFIGAGVKERALKERVIPLLSRMTLDAVKAANHE